jgi:hypothetical protein
MAYTDDQMGPRRRALVDGLAGNTGISGAMPGGMGMPQIGGLMDAGAKMTPGGNSAKAGFGAGMGGIMDAAAKMAPGGSLAKPADGAAAPAPTYAPIQGFDFGKLSGTKAYDSKEKYSDAVRNFSQALGSGVQVGRNNLGGAVDYAHAHGLGGAKAVGDDKIDFGDGAGPIDVVKSDGSIWFQNGPDRLGPAAGAQGAAQGAAHPSFAGSTVAPMLQGDAQSNIQGAMQQMGALGNTSRIQQLIAALSGGGQ